MAAEAMEAINFHLGRAQNRALRERARRRGTRVADELRSAVDSYLCGAQSETLELLDAATARAESALRDMNVLLEATNRRADMAFAELDRIRKGGAVQG